MALTETWLDASIRDSELMISCYVLLRRDRSRQGGGVCLYMRDSLVIHSRSYHDSAELLSVSVQTGHGLLLLSVLYRPPGLDGDLAVLQSTLGSLNLPGHRHALLVGDFNVDLSEGCSTRATALLDLMGLLVSLSYWISLLGSHHLVALYWIMPI